MGHTIKYCQMLEAKTNNAKTEIILKPKQKQQYSKAVEEFPSLSSTSSVKKSAPIPIPVSYATAIMTQAATNPKTHHLGKELNLLSNPYFYATSKEDSERVYAEWKEKQKQANKFIESRQPILRKKWADYECDDDDNIVWY